MIYEEVFSLIAVSGKPSFNISYLDGRIKYFRSCKQNKPKRRAISKDGDFFTIESPKKRAHFVRSIFTGLVQMKLSQTITIFLIVLLASWLIFAVLWWLISYSHGDFETSHLPTYQVSSNFTPCIHEMYSFISCFLFSIETQHTVGYGIRATTEECPEAIFLNAVQCTLGTILQGIMSGIIFTKLTLPNKRAQTVIFSKNAVVALRDGCYQLMFRVGDIRDNHIIEIKIKAYLMRTVKTIEGEVLRLYRTPLKIKVDECGKDIPLIWPVTAAHEIDKNSPLYGITAQQLKRNLFEVIVILEGTIESTGQSMQARTSYLPSEILWGCKFEEVLKFNKFLCEYEVDYSKFETIGVVKEMIVSSPIQLKAIGPSCKTDDGSTNNKVVTGNHQDEELFPL